MRIIGIVQSRLGGTRLPGKVLLPLAGAPLLFRLLERVNRAESLSHLVVACPRWDAPRIQDALIADCDLFSCETDEADLIARYRTVAEDYRADVIVRICGDNPCIESWAIDYAISEYLNGCHPFVTTMGDTAFSQWPDGIGCEVFSSTRLKWLDQKTKTIDGLREHPHRWFHEHQAAYEPPYRGPVFPRGLKLDVNTHSEYEYVKDIFESLYPTSPAFGIGDIVAHLNQKESCHAATAR